MFCDVQRKTSRIKEFSLKEALIYSYVRDMRFVLLTCLLIGFSVWWFSIPEQLLVNPRALSSPDLELVVRVGHIPEPCLQLSSCPQPVRMWRAP